MARTTELIDKRTGDRVKVPNDMVAQALRSRQFSVSPENVYDGNIGLVRHRKTELFPTTDKKEIMGRLQSGYSLEPIRETHKRRLKEEYGETAVTAMALANSAMAAPTLGLSTQILRRMPFFGASPDALAAIDEMSPTAATVGMVGGTVADLVTGKGFLTAALKGSKTLAAKVGVKATALGAGPTLARTARLTAEGAAEGALFAETQLIHENALGNAELTGQILSTAATGALWGSVGGGVVGLGTPMVSAVWGTGTKLAKKGYAGALAAVQEGGPTPGIGPADNIIQNVFKWAQGKYSWEALEGLKKHATRMAEQDIKFPWKSEKAIREWMANKNMVELGDSLATIDAKANTILNQVGKEVGEFYGTLDEVAAQMAPFGPKPKAMSLPSGREPIIGKAATVIEDEGLFPMARVLKALDEKIAKESAIMGTTDTVNALKRSRAELLRKYGEAVPGHADVSGLGMGVPTPVAATARVRRTTFRNAHESMVKLASKASYESTAKETALREASAFLRGVYNETLEKTAEGLLKAKKDPGLFKRWKFLKDEYGKARTVADITKDTLAGQKNRTGIGLRGTVVSAGAIGAGAGPFKAAAVAGAWEGARRYGRTTIAATAGALKRMKVVKDGTMSTMARTVRNFVKGSPSKILGAVEDATGMTGRSLALPAGVKILQSVSFDPQAPAAELSEDNVRAATRLTKQLSSLVSQPEVVAERVAANISEIEEVAPNTARAVVQAEIRKLEHLHAVAPKYSYSASTLQPLAFSEDYITEGDAEKFSRHLHAALQPIPALFNDLADGTLMPETIQTISTVYPQLMEWIRSQFRDGYVETKIPIPYSTNAMLATLMGEATTRDMTAGFQARHTAVWGGGTDSSMPTMSRAAEGSRQKNVRPETDRVQSSLIG